MEPSALSSSDTPHTARHTPLTVPALRHASVRDQDDVNAEDAKVRERLCQAGEPQRDAYRSSVHRVPNKAVRTARPHAARPVSQERAGRQPFDEHKHGPQQEDQNPEDPPIEDPPSRVPSAGAKPGHSDRHRLYHLIGVSSPFTPKAVPVPSVCQRTLIGIGDQVNSLRRDTGFIVPQPCWSRITPTGGGPDSINLTYNALSVE
jgi:hypothetical protein